MIWSHWDFPRNFSPDHFRPRVFFSPPQFYRLSLMLSSRKLWSTATHPEWVRSTFQINMSETVWTLAHVMKKKKNSPKFTSLLVCPRTKTLYSYTLSGGQWAVAGHTAYTSAHPANMARDRILSPSSVLSEILDMKVYVNFPPSTPPHPPPWR